MFGRNKPIVYLRYIDAAVEFSPQAVKKSAVVLQPFLVGIKIMLQIFGQTVFIRSLALGLADRTLNEQLHRNAERLCKLIHRFR